LTTQGARGSNQRTSFWSLQENVQNEQLTHFLRGIWCHARFLAQAFHKIRWKRKHTLCFRALRGVWMRRVYLFSRLQNSIIWTSRTKILLSRRSSWADSAFIKTFIACELRAFYQLPRKFLFPSLLIPR
jgi:hypothetical protein